MSHEAIDWAIKQEAGGNAPRKLILVLLANRADDAWVCWPSRRLLAEESGLSVRQVVRHLTSLEEDGLIRRVPWERADGGQGANVFALGPTATDAPVSCTTRGGGRVRHGGWSSVTPGGSHTRHPLNPQKKSTGKPSLPAAREESRRRSPANAVETHRTALPQIPADLTAAQIFGLVEAASRNPQSYAEQIATIKARAPRLWRDAVDRAENQFRREDKLEKVDDREHVEHLAYQYTIVIRKKNLPAWLIGPLLPYLDGETTSHKAA